MAVRFIRCVAKAPAACGPVRVYPTIPFAVWQTRLSRIVSNVLHDSEQMLFVADDAVVTFFDPDHTMLASQLIDLKADIAFPTGEDVFEFETVERLHDNVAMVGHDAVTRSEVPLVLEMHTRIGHQFGMSRRAEQALTISLIHPAFSALGDFSRKFLPLLLGPWSRSRAFPDVSPPFELLQFLLRQGIGQAKRDKVGRTRLPPMRQMTLIASHGQIGMKSSKVWRRMQHERIVWHGDLLFVGRRL